MKGCIKSTPGQRVLAAEDRVSMMEEQQEASVAGTVCEGREGETGQRSKSMGGKLVGPCDHGDDCGFSLE